MQAIKSVYLGPTNNRGSRIKASCERGSITIPYPHELSGDEVHREAVTKLLDRFAQEDVKQYGSKYEDAHWGEFVTGSLADCTVHVLIGRKNGIFQNKWQS